MFPPTRGRPEIQREETKQPQQQTFQEAMLEERFRSGNFELEEEKIVALNVQRRVLLSYHGEHDVEYEAAPREIYNLDSSVNAHTDAGKALVVPHGWYMLMMTRPYDPVGTDDDAKRMTLLVAKDDMVEVAEAYELSEGCEINTTTLQEKEIRPHEPI